MADLKDELRQAMDQFVQKRVPVILIPATVVSYDEDFAEVDCTDAEGNEYYGVSMAAAPGYSVGIQVRPTIGSAVIIGDVGNSETRLIVLSFSEVDQVVIKSGSCKVEVTPDGITIGKAESLATVLGDLITQIKLIQVTCAAPGAPSTVPINVAAFDLIANRINAILQ